MLATKQQILEAHPEFNENYVAVNTLNTKKALEHLWSLSQQLYKVIMVTPFPVALYDADEIGYKSPVVGWCDEHPTKGAVISIVLRSDYHHAYEETYQHEWVHANQMKDGRLHYTGDPNVVIWEGNTFKMVPKETHWATDAWFDIYVAKIRSTPWELEADSGLTMYGEDYTWMVNQYGKPWPDFCHNKEVEVARYIDDLGFTFREAVQQVHLHIKDSTIYIAGRY